jgi:bifunctional UDP-N-acetylglucosamine pyrophosphorylase / glucosamine-1-phosphate N-acetyltransferase
MRDAILDDHMERGVTIADRTVYIERHVRIGKDTTILPCCSITGTTEIGEEVTIGPHAVINDAVVESGSVIEPFTRIKGGRVVQNKDSSQ